MTLRWEGDKVRDRVLHAAADGIDDTLRDADAAATASHEWQNRTGNLEENIITEAAHRDGNEIVGRFGTTYSPLKGTRSGFYGLFLEEGTRRIAPRPFLRPAADATFPGLAEKIREKLK